ncbi:serine/threonine-protein kinase [Planomonospora venezuelensis]|uniref:non-specific serine/threonine protein kinase n=1 Tax=Planomonospora venezuelensis TaxID=1999 RepID=A0A841D8A3_PLAVE|nr:serine/threonine-protein kinase [Planomonospora venezuelensis]MBB5964797.1 serine/threonine protein kinase [Planomonospora venezuelensis]
MQSGGHQEERRVAGRYRLLEPIGRGGMGTVWKAHDELLDRTVAVKEVRYSAALGEDVQTLNQRMMREARAAARLSHPNVVVVYDVIEENEQPWIVMQLVQSRSLGQVLREDGPLPPRRVAEIGLALLEALHSAHDAGVLHRDVKPENVLLAHNGRVVLTDFGIAKLDSENTLTMTGVAGTPAFIAPERLRGLPARRESDLWSLGATLYAAVEGRSPHDRKLPLPTMHSVMTDPPDPARNAGPLLPVLEGLLRKEPVQRLTYAETSAMLRKVAEGRSSTQPWAISQIPPASAGSPAAPRTGSGSPAASAGPPAAERRKPYAPVPPRERTPSAPADGERAAAPAGAEPPAPAARDKNPAGREPAAGAADEAAAGQAPAAIPQTGQVAKLPAPEPAAPGAGKAPSASSEAAGAGAEETPPPPPEAGRSPSAVRDAAEPPPSGAETPSVPSPAVRDYVRNLVARSAATSPDSAPPDPAPPYAPGPPAQDLVPSGQEQTRLGTLSPVRVRRVLPAILVALALVAVLGVWIGMTSDSPGAAGRRGPGTAGPEESPSEDPGAAEDSSSAAPSPSKTGKKKADDRLPDGWRMHKDPNGFSIGLPKGWKVVERAGRQVRFEVRGDPVSYLMVEYTDTPGSDAKKDWEKQEPYSRGNFPGYKRIRIEKVDYMEDAADWEFTWRIKAGKARVINRGFVTKGGRGYAIYWHTLASDWKKNLKLFEGFTETFSSKK